MANFLVVAKVYKVTEVELNTCYLISTVMDMKGYTHISGTSSSLKEPSYSLDRRLPQSQSRLGSDEDFKNGCLLGCCSVVVWSGHLSLP
jgi:hypothetical protein